MSKTSLKRPHYATAMIYRQTFELAREAAHVLREDNIVFFSKAAEQRALPVLKRRAAKLAKLSVLKSSNGLNHNLIT